MNIFQTILVNAVLIALLDTPWLYITKGFVNNMITDIQGAPLRLKILPAIPVYIALGYLATIPKTALDAFAIGLATYAVYDGTNLATIAKYDWRFAIADSLWGGVLFLMVFMVKQHFSL
jgi:uncharacterized membrane protein